MYLIVGIGIIAHSAEINKPDKFGKTALHYACENGNLAPAESLIAHSAEINKPDKTGKTALHYACEKGNLALAESLIAHSAEINKPDISEKTALHYACKNGNIALVEELITHGAEFVGVNPLRFTSDIEIAKVLTKIPDFFDVPDGNGNTLLIIFCQQGNKDIVDLLMKQEAWPGYLDYAENADKKTALMYTTNAEIAIELIKQGANINARDSKGRTALDYIVNFSVKTEKENPELFNELIGTIVNTQTPETIEAAKKNFSKKGIDIKLTIAQHQAKKAVKSIDFSTLRGPSPVNISSHLKEQLVR